MPVHRIDSDIDDHGSALRAGERVHPRIRERKDQRGASVAPHGRLVPDSGVHPGHVDRLLTGVFLTGVFLTGVLAGGAAGSAARSSAVSSRRRCPSAASARDVASSAPISGAVAFVLRRAAPRPTIGRAASAWNTASAVTSASSSNRKTSTFHCPVCAMSRR